MKLSTLDHHDRYVAERSDLLSLCVMARAMGNKFSLRMLQTDALLSREMAGIGRPRDGVTAQPLSRGKNKTLKLAA